MLKKRAKSYYQAIQKVFSESVKYGPCENVHFSIDLTFDFMTSLGSLKIAFLRQKSPQQTQ